MICDQRQAELFGMPHHSLVGFMSDDASAPQDDYDGSTQSSVDELLVLQHSVLAKLDEVIDLLHRMLPRPEA